MRFGSSSTNFTYSLNNCSIRTKSSHSDVGILLTNTLSWSLHISNILSKAYRSLGLIRRTVPYCSTISLKKSLYLTLVRCYLAYCPQIWRPHLVQDSRAIERLKRRATKYIIAADMDYKSRLANLSLLPLTLWLEFLDILLLIKLLQNPPDNFNISNFIVPASSRVLPFETKTCQCPSTPPQFHQALLLQQSHSYMEYSPTLVFGALT